jgi:predicted patatin/cPLA2 family phospholipase
MQKKKINIILPGGGAKAVYQIGFLEVLSKSEIFNKHYSIEYVAGTSAGALIGAYFLSGQLNTIKTRMLSYDSLDQIIRPWINLSFIPFIGRTLSNFFSLIVGLFKNGLFNKDFIYEMIGEIKENSLDGHISLESWSSKLHVSLVNYEKGITVHYNKPCKNTEDLNLLKRYIAGSMSLWGIFPPERINDQYYIDGGLLDLYPFNPDCKNKWHLRKDETYLILDTQLNRKNEIGDLIYPMMTNILKKFTLSYLIDLLNIAVTRNGYFTLCNYLSHNDNIIHIAYPDTNLHYVCKSAVEYDKVLLKNTCDEGRKAAEAFILRYCK